MRSFIVLLSSIFAIGLGAQPTPKEAPVPKIVVGIKTEAIDLRPTDKEGKRVALGKRDRQADISFSTGGFDFRGPDFYTSYSFNLVTWEGRTLKIGQAVGEASVRYLKINKYLKDNFTGVNVEIFKLQFDNPRAEVTEVNPANHWEFSIPAGMPIEFEVTSEQPPKIVVTNFADVIKKINESIDTNFSDAALKTKLKPIEFKNMNHNPVEKLAADLGKAHLTKILNEGKPYEQLRNIMKNEVAKEAVVTKFLYETVNRNLLGFPLRPMKAKLYLGDKAGDMSLLVINSTESPTTFAMKKEEKLKVVANQAGWNLLLDAKLHHMINLPFNSYLGDRLAFLAAKNYLIYRPTVGEKKEWADMYEKISGSRIVAEDIFEVCIPIAGERRPNFFISSSSKTSLILRSEIEFFKVTGQVLGKVYIDPYFVVNEKKIALSNLKLATSRLNQAESDVSTMTELNKGARLFLMQFLLNQMIHKNTDKLDFEFLKPSGSEETLFSVSVRE